MPDIARPLLMMALAGAFTFEFETSLPLLAEKTFHGGATTYSWLIGALGAGAVAGGLYAARSGRTGVARLTSAAVFYAIAVGLVAAAPSWPAAVAACVVAGAATITFLTTGNATIQLAAEPGYRGRVTALWSMALAGSTAIGSPVIGALSDLAGPRYALALGAAACLAAAAIGHWRSTRASPRASGRHHRRSAVHHPQSRRPPRGQTAEFIRTLSSRWQPEFERGSWRGRPPLQVLLAGMDVILVTQLREKPGSSNRWRGLHAS